MKLINLQGWIQRVQLKSRNSKWRSVVWMASTCSYACPRTSDRAPDEPIEDLLPDLDQHHWAPGRSEVQPGDIGQNEVCSVRFSQGKSAGTSQWYQFLHAPAWGVTVGPRTSSRYLMAPPGRPALLCNTSLIKKCIRQWCSRGSDVSPPDWACVWCIVLSVHDALNQVVTLDCFHWLEILVSFQLVVYRLHQ